MSNPSPQPPDMVPSDDAVIGRAVRRSLAVLVAIGLLVAGVEFLRTRFVAEPKTQVTELEAPNIPAKLLQEIPSVSFTDITKSAGIGFMQVNGAYGEKLLPETMGGGVAFFDFDADGDQDLLFVNATYWPDKVPEGTTPPTLALYENDGTGKFADVTKASGLDVSLYGMGVAVGDYNNDGWVDVFITAVGKNRLFRNLGDGRFLDETDISGVGGAETDWSTSAAWLDYNNDGRLDLFVCNYVQWSREMDLEVDYQLVGIGRAYGPPMNFPGSFPRLYRNEGNGKFTDVSAIAGVQVKNPATGAPMAKSLGVAPVDINNDGWIDLVVANDTVQNFVFTNRHDGTFREIGARTGIAFDSYGQTRGAMGIDAARFRNDNSLGIAIGNFANEMNALYVSQNDTVMFADEAITEGVGPASRLLLKFGLFFFDYDLDGHLDVLTANGHLEEDIHKVQASQRYRQPAQLFWNRGARSGSSFVPVPVDKSGTDLFQPIVGRGSAFADIDNDGDLDVVLTQVAGAPLLLRNDQELKHQWVRFKLIGSQANRDAIGAWIQVKVGRETLARQVMPTRGYLSQSELPVTIGLGKAERVDSVEILWPDGSRQIVKSVRLNAVNEIRQSF